MKTMYLLMTLLVVFVTSTSFATEKPRMTISANDNQMASIRFESPVPTWYEITIQDNKGELVYYKKSNERSQVFTQDFDFSSLNAGKYDVCVNYGNQSLNRELNVTPNGIETSPAEFFYEPYFKVEDGKLNVSFLNVAQKEVYLNIYKDNQLVYGVYLGNEMEIQKRLDLNQLERGDYEIVMREWFKNHSTGVQL